MNRGLIEKGIGLALVLSGIIILVLKAISIPEAKEGWSSFASPNDGTALLAGVLVIELLFLAARFFLGYIHFQNKHLRPWVFYPIVVIVAISGLSGIILAIGCLASRLWQGQGHHVAKT